MGVVNTKTKPQMATVRPKVFPMAERDTAKQAEVVKEGVQVAEDDLRTKVLQFMQIRGRGQPRRGGHHCLRRKGHGQA